MVRRGMSLRLKYLECFIDRHGHERVYFRRHVGGRAFRSRPWMTPRSSPPTGMRWRQTIPRKAATAKERSPGSFSITTPPWISTASPSSTAIG
jgi:hypothetical protein